MGREEIYCSFIQSTRRSVRNRMFKWLKHYTHKSGANFLLTLSRMLSLMSSPTAFFMSSFGGSFFKPFCPDFMAVRQSSNSKIYRNIFSFLTSFSSTIFFNRFDTKRLLVFTSSPLFIASSHVRTLIATKESMPIKLSGVYTSAGVLAS